MKKLIASLSLVLSTLSFATAEFVPVYGCKFVPEVADAQRQVEVIVSDSSYAGITQAAVTEGTTETPSGKTGTHHYFVRHEVDSQSVLYVGTGARGQNFELSIFPGRVSPEGGMVGVLLLEPGKDLELSCRYLGGEVNLDN